MREPATVYLRTAIRPAILFLLAGLLASACSGEGEELQGTGPSAMAASVTGTVTNSGTGRPVAGAEVSIGAAEAATGADGRFILTGLTAGSATLRCAAPGFEDFETDVTVASGSVTRDIQLVRLAPDPKKARLRVLQVQTAWPTMDVFVDDALVLNDLPSLSASEYLEVEAAWHRVTFRVFQGWEEISGDFAAGGAYTAIPCCPRFPNSYLLADDPSEPGAGNGKLRVIQVSSEAALDIYVTAPGADIAAATPTFTLGTSWASDYIELPAGDYQVRVTRFKEKAAVLDSTLTLEAGQVRSAVAMDARKGHGPLRFLVLEDVN